MVKDENAETLPPELVRRIEEIASDTSSGASEILERVNVLLAETVARGGPVRAAARALCGAQPTMAGVWNAALHAVAAEHDPAVFAAFAARVARSGEALVRFGLDCFDAAGPRSPLRLATVSFSRSVATVISALSRSRQVHVACAEGRPAFEGRRMAAMLAAGGASVTCYTDAALGHALGTADAVVVGADAMTPEAVINKCGTRLVAAAAAQQGVPVHVVASREKFVSHAVSLHLALREGSASEVWDTPAPGILIRNPYFEPTPLDLITSVITESGVIGAALVPDVCAASPDARLLAELLRAT